MASEPEQVASREQRFQEVLVQLVEANDTGQTLKPEEWRVRYPEFAEELDEFFAGRKHVNELAGAFRQAAGVAVQAREVPTVGAQAQVQGTTRVRYFGDYELLAEIARGGMGVVYRARQVSLNRVVALKMILSGCFAGEADLKRFHREAEAAANLDHPNIVPIYEVGEHEGLHYYSMKLVEGGNLGQWLADSRLQITDSQRRQRDAVQMLVLVARAVHHAHQRGILHRDLKPANILLQNPSGQSAIRALQSALPLVTDFGLARRVEGEPQVTRSGSIVGTPSYMPPEQAASRKDLSVAVDVYSLGAILYELLAGRPPFVAATALDVVLQVLHQEATRPRSINPRIDRDLEIICLKCLRKEPRERYGSAEALAEDLQRWLDGEPIEARPSSAWERTVKWTRRRPAMAALCGLAFLLLVGIVTASWVFVRQQQQLLHEQLETEKQKSQADIQSRLAQERHVQSLMGEARAERLAGNRARSLALLAEAARLDPRPALRQEAIQTVTSPGLRLLHEIPVGFINTMQFSPDGTILAVHGVFGAGPGMAAGDPGPRATQRLKVWRMPSGELLGDTYLPASIGNLHVGQSYYRPYRFSEYNPFLPSPQSPLIALKEPQGDKVDKVRLWDPARDRAVAELSIRRYPLSVAFSRDGRRLAAPAWDPKREAVQVWDIAKAAAEKPFAAGAPLAFVSDDELVTSFWDGADNRLQRVAVSTGKQLGITPAGTGVLTVSADGRTAALVKHAAKTGDPVLVWDVLAGKELAAIPGAVPVGYSPFGAQFSRDGSYFAIDDPLRPNTFKLWERASGRLREGLNGAVYGGGSFNHFQRAAFSPNAALLMLYAQKDHQSLHLWDVHGERRLATLRDNHTPIFSGDGHWLATIAPGKLRRADGREYGEDRTFARIWQVVYPLPAANVGVPVEALSFRSRGKELLANNRLIRIEPDPVRPVLVASPYRPDDPPAFFQAGEQLWALDPGSIAPHRPARLVRRTPPGKEFLLKMPALKPEPHARKDIKLVAMPLKNAWAIDREGRRLVAVCQVHHVFPKSTGSSFSSDDRILAAWDLETGEVQVMQLVPQPNDVPHVSGERRGMECLALDPTEKLLAAGDSDGVTFWDLATHKRKLSIRNLITTSRVLEGSSSRGGSGAGPFEYTFKVWCIRFSPDGRRLFTASSSGRVDVNE